LLQSPDQLSKKWNRSPRDRLEFSGPRIKIMLQPIAILATVAGVGLALAALLLDGTGVTGSAGAVLAVIGSIAAFVGLVIRLTLRLPPWLHSLILGLSVLAAGLTALAAWFLMQNALCAVMAIACLTLLGVAARPSHSRDHLPLRRI
jgi:quinoprotein glucose dehydrogenase